ncbi:hypothetical protein U9M48_026603, partial [Paspalum notatum var. saurae]
LNCPSRKQSCHRSWSKARRGGKPWVLRFGETSDAQSTALLLRVQVAPPPIYECSCSAAAPASNLQPRRTLVRAFAMKPELSFERTMMSLGAVSSLPSMDLRTKNNLGCNVCSTLLYDEKSSRLRTSR